MIDDASTRASDADAGGEDEAGYAYRVVTVDEAVERAVSGEWDVPEFQREFVWQPSQVCGLADSLWRDYPIGALLLWRGARSKGGSRRPRWWIADGQQRLTSLCILCGREPIWLGRKPSGSRARRSQRCEPWFDVGAEAAPGFVAARTATGAGDPRLISVSRLMAIDPREERGRSELARLVSELKALDCCRELDAAQAYRRLSQVSMIRQRKLVAILVQHEREDVLEIFARLNSRGMRFRRLLLKLAMEEIPAAIRGLRRR